jgi:hypothetical protein
LAKKDYDATVALIDGGVESENGSAGRVLKNLDKGAALHFAGRYTESDAALEQAEKDIEEAKATAAARAGGAPADARADVLADYMGPDYELPFLLLLRALNHLFLDRPRDALAQASKASEVIASANAVRPPEKQRSVPLARIVTQSAEVNLGMIGGAPAPGMPVAGTASDTEQTCGLASAEPWAPLPPGQAELLFVHFNGPAPEVSSVREQASPKDPDQAQVLRVLGLTPESVAFSRPEFRQRPYRIVGSMLSAGSMETSTILAGDVSEYARKALGERAAAIRTRSFARAAIRQAAYQAAQKAWGTKPTASSGGVVGFLGSASLASNIAEPVDTRLWNTISSQIRIGCLRLPAGSYDVKIVFVDGSGRPLYEDRFPEVILRPGRRSFVQARSLM